MRSQRRTDYTLGILIPVGIVMVNDDHNMKNIHNTLYSLTAPADNFVLFKTPRQILFGKLQYFDIILYTLCIGI